MEKLLFGISPPLITGTRWKWSLDPCLGGQRTWCSAFKQADLLHNMKYANELTPLRGIYTIMFNSGPTQPMRLKMVPTPMFPSLVKESNEHTLDPIDQLHNVKYANELPPLQESI